MSFQRELEGLRASHRAGDVRRNDWNIQVAALDGLALRDLVPLLREVEGIYIGRGEEGNIRLDSPQGKWGRQTVEEGELVSPYTSVVLEWTPEGQGCHSISVRLGVDGGRDGYRRRGYFA